MLSALSMHVACRAAKPLRPPPGEQASLQLFVTMFQEEVKIYRDVSGASLHRRGYRGVVHKAALNESAAAGLLYIAGWPELAAQGMLPSLFHHCVPVSLELGCHRHPPVGSSIMFQAER